MTHYSGDTIVVDAEALVDDLRDEQQRIEAESERIGDADFDITDSEFVALADDETASDIDDETFREWLRKEYRTRDHQIDELESKFHTWGGSKFTIKHLTPGDEARIGDWVSSKAIAEDQSDVRTQQQAARLIEVAVGVTQVPGDVDIQKRDGIAYVREALPSVLVRWLYDRIENLTNYGEADLDDFSDLPPSLAPDSAQS